MTKVDELKNTIQHLTLAPNQWANENSLKTHYGYTERTLNKAVKVGAVVREWRTNKKEAYYGYRLSAKVEA